MAEADGEVARALQAFVRAEFQTPVSVLRDLIEILREDAGSSGIADYDDDLLKMRGAAERLFDMVSAHLDGGAASAPSATGSSLRHDLRTPVTAVVGYGELIAEEARESGHVQLFPPLADVLDAAGRLLKDIDRLVAFSANAEGGDRAQGGGASPAVPDLLRNAVEVVHRLARHAAPLARTVTGRILVVDDNAAMRDLVSRRLARDGHDVVVCSSGRAALALAAAGGFDLMLLDLMMPGMNGLEVLDRLRAQPPTASLPVIVISALDETDAAVRCIEAGADDYLSKPLNETLLRARMTASLDRKFLRDREQDALGRLREEQERSEGLLLNVLPADVVERLRAGATRVADHFDEVTVLFCDLVGFTALSAVLPPAETLDLLNEIFSGFDGLAEENGLEKIKTIGDAYMVVGGMSAPVAHHARRVVRMACGMPAVAAAVAPGRALGVRIGIDTGPAVAGIIGRRKFFYDVWGDTVNTASRLEALSEPGRIHVSEATRAALDDAFRCDPRPPLDVRGKGTMQTYFVEAEDGAGAA